MQYQPVTCVQLTSVLLNCSDGQQWAPVTPILDDETVLFWIYLSMSIVLVLFAGLCSGLTLGLLSLDVTTLTIILHGSDEKKKQYAKRIIKLVSRHHQLLVTLLLSNAAAMETLPIFLDRISSTGVAIVVSVTAVLFFGEIIPQAVCSRYGLAIGANLSWIVWILMIITWPLNWPLGKLLDRVIGVEQGTFYQRDELKQLVDMHSKSARNEEGLTVDEISVIKGALDMKLMTVEKRMVPLQKVFMKDENTLLNKSTLEELRLQAHSRIPVYRGSRGNVIGIAIVKDLVGIDPQASHPIKNLLRDTVVRVTTSMSLFELLNIFQTGAGHMAMVYPSLPEEAITTLNSVLTNSENQTQQLDQELIIPEAIGICTLEDVLETLLRKEIRDEKDYARMKLLLNMPSRPRGVVSAAATLTTPINPYADSNKEIRRLASTYSDTDRLVTTAQPPV